MKKRFISFITSALVAALCINSAAVKYSEYGSNDVLTASAAAAGINVQYRTQQEISGYISSHPFSCSFEDTYAVQPSVTSPYSAGKLSETSLTNALNSLNVMRYIAGLDEVTLDSSYCELTQASSLVNCVNGSLSHFPTQPSGMSDDIYNLGYSGSGKSNIAYNAGSFARNTAWSVVYAWMYDEDDYNIDRVGHRRWCLNPTMGKTGFGAVSRADSRYGTARYSAMYAFDRSNPSADEYGVCWPAQNTPVEFFTQEDPWSISMGTSVDASKVKVTLKRQSDGKTWSFSSSSADGQFYVNNEGYGQSGCMIFLPNNIGTISAGDSFDVNITGLSQNVSYTVNFFQSGFVNTVPGSASTTTKTTTATTTTTTTSTTSTRTSTTTTTASATTTTKTVVTQPAQGDVNADGMVDGVDASMILVYNAESANGVSVLLNAAQIKRADVNRDGLTDGADASMILAYNAYATDNDIGSIDDFIKMNL